MQISAQVTAVLSQLPVMTNGLLAAGSCHNLNQTKYERCFFHKFA